MVSVGKVKSPQLRPFSWSRRAERLPPSTQPSIWYNVAKACIFTSVGSATCFAGAVVWEYENVRQLMTKNFNFNWRSVFTPDQKQGEWRQMLHDWWIGLSEGQRVFWPICFVNVLVFLAWRSPVLESTLLKYFASSPASSHVLSPMIFSAFSHASPLHLACNMYVLHSFSTGAVDMLGKEQFLALYLSGALFSSLFSYLVKSVSSSTAVSIGASGAIMTILAFVCVTAPDTRLAIIFLPGFTFTAGTAIRAMIMFDALGVLFRWSIFDHAAHLGGSLLGMFWALYGRQNLWENRAPVIRWYHDIRENYKKK